MDLLNFLRRQQCGISPDLRNICILFNETWLDLKAVLSCVNVFFLKVHCTFFLVQCSSILDLIWYVGIPSEAKRTDRLLAEFKPLETTY